MGAKRFFLALFLGFFLCGSLYAQFYITGMQQLPSVYPQPVKVLVDLALPSAGCPHNPFTASLSGNRVLASATHCLGFLTTICNTTDTFELQLPSPGQYSFVYSLSLGSIPVPCTPSGLPPQTDSLLINYPDPLGMYTYGLNPAPLIQGSTLHVPEQWKGASCSLFALDGRCLMMVSSLSQNEYPLASAEGIYLLVLRKEHQTWRNKIMIP